MRKLLLFSLFAVNLVGCASYFTRKECESTNWFQHGQDVAMGGKNLENDTFLNQCRKVEAEIDEGGLDRGFKKGRANYCEPETAFATGKKGDLFAGDMCDGGNVATLRRRHADGVKQYCAASNGDAAGATGKAYQNVCPDSMEAAFLKEFAKGRKRYLAAEIESRQAQVDDIDKDIRNLQDERAQKTNQLARVGTTSVVRSEKTYDAFGRRRTTTQEVSVADDSAQTTNAKQMLKQDIDSLEWNIRTKRESQTKVREEIRKLRSEMMAL